MNLVLEGNIITPIITKKTTFHINGCKATIKHPRIRYYTKINTGKPMYPYSYIAYLGTLELRYKCQTKQKAKRKLTQLLQINQIGRHTTEGLGKIQWQGGHIEENPQPRTRPTRKLRIRKGLPHHLPAKVKELLQYALLHDFYTTGRHRSKIYTEPELHSKKLMEKLRRHHEKHTRNNLIKTFQHYDRLAARITRTYPSPTTSRYNWQSTQKVDFTKLAHEVADVANNIWKLYNYIYDSNELKQINESLKHGHTNLRKHLIIIANLIVQDFQRGTLERMHTKG